MLTGFVNVTDEKKKEANESLSISLGTSPFQNGITFKVGDFNYKQVENDGKVDINTRVNPVLTTSVGDLFLSMIIKPKIDASGKIHEPNGDFNRYVKNTIQANLGKSNGEILQAIVDGCKGREIVVTRTHIDALSKDGRHYPTSFIVLDFKK